MLPIYLILALGLAAIPQAYAQEAAETQASSERPAREAQSRRAVPRAGAPRAQASRSADDQRRAVPRGSRPQGDNPRTGTAVPRATRPVPGPDRGRSDVRRPTVIVRPPVYNNYYYYPRRGPLYGYGAFGPGYFYSSPYGWYPGTSAYGGSFYYRQPLSSFDDGELRLDISPRDAQVYVDGYYAGTVDDFDGAFQSLKLESGPYHIEIVAPGYETMEFDVRITAGQKITYRSDLLRRP